MSELDPKKTRKHLLNKGFMEAPGDHHYLEFWHEGILVTKTKISRGTTKIYDQIIGSMASQCQVGQGFFKEFAKCNKSKDDYIEQLRIRKIIS